MDDVKKELPQEAQPVQAISEQKSKEAEKPVEKAVETQESIQDRNWRQFRENREKERKEAQEAALRAKQKEAEAEALKAALAAVVNKPSQPQYNQSYEQTEETEEQRIERKVAELLEKKEKDYERRRQEQEVVELPKRMESTFKDFNQVCSAENLDYLEYHHPELARSLGSRGQSFEKWADIYNAIKRYVPNSESKKEMNRADKNLAKPQSASSPGVTQGSEGMPSSRLDKQRKQENWMRMQRTMKGLS